MRTENKMNILQKLQQSNENTSMIGFRLPKSLHDKLETFCKKNKISKASFLVEAIHHLFDKIEETK